MIENNKHWMGYKKAYRRNVRTKLLFLYQNSYITRSNYIKALTNINVLQ